MKTLPTLAALSLAVLSLSVSACGTSALDAKSAHDQGNGTVQIYDATADQAWAAAHAAIRWNDVGAARDYESPNGRYALTDPAQFDQIGVWIEPVAPNKTRVSVVVIDDDKLPGPDERGVQKDIGSAVNLAKSGAPLDKRP